MSHTVKGASVTGDHLDYLQRSAPGLAPVAADASLTRAPAELRRLWHVKRVGRVEKRPLAGNRLADPARDPRGRIHGADVLVSLYGSRVPIAFLVRGTGGQVSVNLGTWAPSGRDEVSTATLDARRRIVRAAVRSMYESVDGEPARDVSLDFPVAGLALGVPTARPPDHVDGAAPLDRLIRALGSADWAILVLAEPVRESVSSGMRHDIIEELRRAHTAGKAEEAPVPLVEHYSALLEATLETCTRGVAVGFWRTAAYLLGDGESYYQLASLWTGIFSGDESLPEPVRVWDIDAAARWAGDWAMPDIAGQPGPGFYQRALEYQTLLTSEQLAAYVHLPAQEASGFAIDLVPSFDVVPPSRDAADAVHVGDVVSRGRPTATPYRVARTDLTRHVLVAGVTGAGKTNTVFRLLEQAAAAAVPFLVLEPAKREYRLLLDHPEVSRRLLVYTLSDERVSPLRLNPFEVPPGTPVAVHLDLLRSLFAASFGMWTPLPQILEQCLFQVYEDRGWDVASNTNARLPDGEEDPDAYPTMSDLAAKVDEVTSRLGYDDRVTADMRAALLTRINGLRTGGKGRMLDVRMPLDVGALLASPAVIELEGMGDDDEKAFMMGLFLIRLLEHRRAAGPVGQLRHLLVIEEAHRLLANVGQRPREEEADPRGKAVETFSNVLAEIRAYGQGVIVSDQVPVKLAPDVIKNTNLKIAHRVVANDDRAALAGSMAMDERQAHALAVLGRGTAAVFSEGDDAPVLVQVARSAHHSGDAPPGDERVVAHMRAAQLDEAGGAPLPLPMCAGVCDGGYDRACTAARGLSERRSVQRLVSRLVQSAVEEPGALDRLWLDLLATVRAHRPPAIDERALLRCLVVRASDWLAQRRGAQAGWPYGTTTGFAQRLRELLVPLARGSAPDDTARAEFRRFYLELHARTYEPFPACARVCRQSPAVCLYRHAAADLVAAGDLAAAWRAASAADPAGSPTSRRRWEVCMDAGRQLIEIGRADWAADRLAAADAAARRASLCFGQQMVAADPSVAPHAFDAIAANLLDGARHE